MKIAIIGPSPVPFTVGGIENLLWGLCNSINQNTKHQVELIKLPSREQDFWSLMDTYQSFYQLDLSYFDMVISTKYPAWMVRHQNHVCYMCHRLRGLYDTYHFMGLPEDLITPPKEIESLLNYMEQNSETDDLNPFFAKLYALKEEKSLQEYFSFPGVFARKIVHFLDDNALSQKNIKKYYSISDTVKRRLDYFPKDAAVKTVYPPSNLKEFSHGSYQYIFMVSRLDGPKRIDMLIRAMQFVTADIKLYIAGTGPQEKELRKLAQGDSRIEFLGFVNDDEVERYYKNCLVVPYFPYDEDYGLITIEAMMHGKPVITTLDAGGPTEFVRDNETGFVVSLEPSAIGEKIDFFAKNPKEAQRMGQNAYKEVKSITWEHVVGTLLDCTYEKKTIKLSRKSVTVTSTFPIYPPQGGGQARIFHIYREMARVSDVKLVSLTGPNEEGIEAEISKGLWEIRTVKSQKHAEKEWDIERQVGMPVTDVAMPQLIENTPEYSSKLREQIEKSDIVIISHPYMYTAAKPYIAGKVMIYEAHNVEYLMKKHMLPSNRIADELVENTFQIEKECCDKSAMVMVCSQEDKERLSELYGINPDKIFVVPNGVDCTSTTFISCNERLQNKKIAGLSGEKIGLFMGSWHGPNLEACEKIFEIATQCPDTKFLLMGSQCMYFQQQKKKLPTNVGLLGLVSEEQKNKIFGLVDFALNPMLSGSGTNLKMFDYMSAGIPIITTAFGTRGIENKDSFMIADISQMASAVNKFTLSQCHEMVDSARDYVEKNFDWKVIVDQFLRDSRLIGD